MEWGKKKKKKNRVAFSIPTTTKSSGGMNLLDIKNYYYASLLDQMKNDGQT